MTKFPLGNCCFSLPPLRHNGALSQTPPEQHKVKVIKKQLPQPHPSINIADYTHCATLICKLEKGLRSGCFTDPVIKLIFPKQAAGAAEVVNGFSLFLCIVMSLYQFYIHHGGRGDGGGGAWWHHLPCGTLPRFAVTVIHRVVHQHSSHWTRGYQDPIIVPLAPFSSSGTARAAADWDDMIKFFSDINRWCYRAAKMLQSPRSCSVKPLNLLVIVADCNSVWITSKYSVRTEHSMWMDTDTKSGLAGWAVTLCKRKWKRQVIVVSSGNCTHRQNGLPSIQFSSAWKHWLPTIKSAKRRAGEMTVPSWDTCGNNWIVCSLAFFYLYLKWPWAKTRVWGH